MKRGNDLFSCDKCFCTLWEFEVKKYKGKDLCENCYNKSAEKTGEGGKGK